MSDNLDMYRAVTSGLSVVDANSFNNFLIGFIADSVDKDKWNTALVATKEWTMKNA